MHSASLLVAAVTFSACSAMTAGHSSDDSSRDVTAAPALGVELSARVRATSPAGDSIVITIHNAAGATRYLSRCGAGPLILPVQFVNGAWGNAVQNFACPVPTAPGPVPLAQGDSVTTVRVISPPATYRFVAIASASADLSNAAQTASNSVSVP